MRPSWVYLVPLSPSAFRGHTEAKVGGRDGSDAATGSAGGPQKLDGPERAWGGGVALPMALISDCGLQSCDRAPFCGYEPPSLWGLWQQP